MDVADRPTSAPARAPAPATPRRGPRPGSRAGVAVLAGLVAACAAALFADGAAAVPGATWLQVGIAAVALVALAARLAERRTGGLRASAPGAAWMAVALLVALAVWTAIAMAWSATPDASWDAANRDLSYALAAAAAIAAGASAPRAPARAAVGLVLAVSLAALWALAGAVAPGVWDDAAREARLHAPLPDFLDLALVCALAAPVAVRLAASGVARVPLRLAALGAALVLVVALAMTFSRAGALALAAGLLVATVAGGARLRALLATLAVLLAAAAPLAVGFSSDALTAPGAPLAQRIDAGRTFGLVLLAALALLLVAGWLALRAESRAVAALTPRRAQAAGLVVALLALAALLGGVAALATSERGLGGSVSHALDTLTAPTPAPRRGDEARLVATDSGGRRLLWSEALGAASVEPVRGWGAGAWPVIHGEYRAADVPARDARSTVLQTLAERGAIGLALLTLAGALLLAAVISRLRALPAGAARDLTAAALGAGAAWTTGAIVVSAWDVPAVTLPVLVLLGVVAARPDEGAGAPAVTDPAAGSDGGRWLALAAGVAALALVATSALLPAWSHHRADAALRVAADPRAGTQDLQRAAADARLSSKLDPPAIAPQLAAAAVAQRRGRLLEARGELLQAVREQSESAEAWARLAQLALDMADRAGGLAAAQRALALDPHDPRLIALAREAEAAQVPPAASPTATGTPLPAFVVR